MPRSDLQTHGMRRVALDDSEEIGPENAAGIR